MELMVEGKLRKVAYFIPIAERKSDGWQVGIAAEGLPQWFATDYRWDCSHEMAEQLAEEMNSKAGISPEEAKRIIDSSILESMKGGVR